MQNYKDLRVWERAHLLVLDVYNLTEKLPSTEIYSLTSQIRRAAVSIPSNIAEGCGRNSQKEFANFLNVALGSANELEYQFLLAKDLQYIDIKTAELIDEKINEIKSMLISLINKVRNNI